MEKTSSDTDYLDQAVGLIDDSSMAKLDFDELKSRLQSVHDRLKANDRLAGEHACLREDYQRRIAGMVKAIAAVDRKQDRYEEAIGLVEELPGLRAEQMLETYRKVSARFRDCFPGSFGSYAAASTGSRNSPAAGRIR